MFTDWYIKNISTNFSTKMQAFASLVHNVEQTMSKVEEGELTRREMFRALADITGFDALRGKEKSIAWKKYWNLIRKKNNTERVLRALFDMVVSQHPAINDEKPLYIQYMYGTFQFEPAPDHPGQPHLGKNWAITFTRTCSPAAEQVIDADDIVPEAMVVNDIVVLPSVVNEKLPKILSVAVLTDDVIVMVEMPVTPSPERVATAYALATLAGVRIFPTRASSQ